MGWFVTDRDRRRTQSPHSAGAADPLRDRPGHAVNIALAVVFLIGNAVFVGASSR